ncbi:unnamed protein product [Polarella glacialis]|uniref:Uncharacterized protein n=1 Tax=Polarella glacialis TaxID=89957 RepID=A0A813K4Z7_POLGL|nr:unnamed protein product [Polarella glacialis]
MSSYRRLRCLRAKDGSGLLGVPAGKGDSIAVLGSGAGRLPVVSFLRGWSLNSLAVEPEKSKAAQAELALSRLRVLLAAYDAKANAGENASNSTEETPGPDVEEEDPASTGARKVLHGIKVTAWQFGEQCPGNRKAPIRQSSAVQKPQLATDQSQSVQRRCDNSALMMGPAVRGCLAVCKVSGQTVGKQCFAKLISAQELAIVGALTADVAIVPQVLASKDSKSLAAKLESDLTPGALVWSFSELHLAGATTQEAVEPDQDGKGGGMVTVPAGGLARISLVSHAESWSRAVVPAPPAALRPSRLLSADALGGVVGLFRAAALQELHRSIELTRLRGSPASQWSTVDESKFAAVAPSMYGVATESAARRLLRAFGGISGSSSAEDWCGCRPSAAAPAAHALDSVGLLAMLLHGVRAVPEAQCPGGGSACTAGDALAALSMAGLRRGLASTSSSSPGTASARELTCLRFSDGRTMLHAALGRGDLQLASAALQVQGPGGWWCRDSEGRSPLHHAAGSRAVRNSDTTTASWAEPRSNDTEVMKWVLGRLPEVGLPELLVAKAAYYPVCDSRTAAFAAGSAQTLKTLFPESEWRDAVPVLALALESDSAGPSATLLPESESGDAVPVPASALPESESGDAVQVPVLPESESGDAVSVPAIALARLEVEVSLSLAHRFGLSVAGAAQQLVRLAASASGVDTTTSSPMLAAVRQAQSTPAAPAAEQLLAVLAEGMGLGEALANSRRGLLQAAGLSEWVAARAAPPEPVTAVQ